MSKHDYYLKNREKIKHRSRKNYADNKKARIAQMTEYKKRAYIKRSEYGGVWVCPKCGKKGYRRFDYRTHKKTGKFDVWTKTLHKHRDNGKEVFENVCIVGVGKL